MSVHSSDLAVRRHERYACDMAAQVSVASSHRDAVRPARSTAGADGAVPARVVDCSLGGIGIQAALFFPVTCRLRVRLMLPSGRPAEFTVRIQRVTMIDRKPTYYIGAALEGGNADAERSMTEVLATLKAAGATLVPEKPRA